MKKQLEQLVERQLNDLDIKDATTEPDHSSTIDQEVEEEGNNPVAGGEEGEHPTVAREENEEETKVALSPKKSRRRKKYTSHDKLVQ